jgi:hypothetical protein
MGLELVHSASSVQLPSYLKEKKWSLRSRKPRLRPWGIRRADYLTSLYPQKLALTSSTSGGRSVGLVRSRTQATDFILNRRLWRCYIGIIILYEYIDIIHRPIFI